MNIHDLHVDYKNGFKQIMTALALTKRTQRGPDDPLPLQRLLQQIRALALCKFFPVETI